MIAVHQRTMIITAAGGPELTQAPLLHELR